MKVLKFLKSVGIDILKNMLGLLQLIMAMGVATILVIIVGYIIAIPLHLLYPSEEIPDCAMGMVLIIVVVLMLVSMIIGIFKYFKRKWNEVK